MQIGQLFTEKRYENGKLIKETVLKFINEDEEFYVFENLTSNKAVFYHLDKNCYPTHRWMISIDIEAYSSIEPLI